MEHAPDLDLVELHCRGCGDAVQGPDGVWVHLHDGADLEICGSAEPVEYQRCAQAGAA